MAEGDGAIYRCFLEDVMEKVHDLVNDAVNVILVTGHVVDLINDNVYADVSGDEVTGTGYTAKGKALAAKAVTETGTAATGTGGQRGKFDAGNVTWTGLNIGGASGSPSHAIMFNDTPTAPADPLIAYWEVTTASNGGNYTLSWHANGILILHK